MAYRREKTIYVLYSQEIKEGFYNMKNYLRYKNGDKNLVNRIMFKSVADDRIY